MESVIACIDGSSRSTAVCDAGAWAAAVMKSPLVLLHALEDRQGPAREDLSGAIGLGSREQLLEDLVALDEQRSRLALEHGRLLLERARERAEEQGLRDIRLQQRHGEVLDSLLDLQSETRLFVLGRAGEDHERQEAAIGSHIESTLRAVDRPLLITVGEFTVPDSFMIAYDGRDTANRAIARIADSPLLAGIPCHLVMVGEDSPEHQAQLAGAEQLLLQRGFAVHSSLLQGDITAGLKAYQQDHKIALLAMGAYGHSRVRQFFVGSNTTRMISSSASPLLILK